MKNLDKKDFRNLFLIHMLCILYLLLFTKSIFGSDLDWLNQHVTVADTIRNTILQTKTLFPDFIRQMMSGCNFYDISYYGYLRPDVLISCLFPSVPMIVFVETYSIVMLLASGSMCYLFMKRHFSKRMSLVLSCVTVSSSVFFHLHSQVMFVNYMPFLFLALIAVDKMKETKRIGLLIFAETMVMLHSYYYSFCCYFVIGIYVLIVINKDKSLLARLFLSFLITVLLTSILTIPTLLVILSNHKDVAAINRLSFFIPSFHLKGLLYNTYGCGLSFLSWILLVLGWNQKETRKLSVFLMLIFIFPVFSYVFSGFLYARSKLLIPFLPLVLYQCATVYEEFKEHPKFPGILQIFLCSLPIAFMHQKFMIVDVVISIIILLLHDKRSIALVLTGCLLLVYEANPADSFVSEATYNKVFNTDIESLIQRNDVNKLAVFSNKQIVNQTFGNTISRASGYTSTYNSRYNSFLFDTLHMNVSSNNRFKENDENNYFYLSLLSIDSIIPTTYIPLGYTQKDTQGSKQLYQSKKVLPEAYATSDLYSQSDFNQLSFPYTLDTLMNHAIIDKKVSSSYQSQFHQITPGFKQDDKVVNVPSSKKIKLKKEKRIKLTFDQSDKILVITCDIKNNDPLKPVDITINGQHNHLSPSNAVYYNNNTTFAYTLSSNSRIDQLNIVLGKGNYTVSNIKFYALDATTVQNRIKQVDPFHQTKSSAVLDGSITVKKDGYFVTTLPYMNGYQITMDGKSQDYEVVNTAFVGFPIKKGKHTITITYQAPGKQIGLDLTGCGIILYTAILWYERKRNED